MYGNKKSQIQKTKTVMPGLEDEDYGVVYYFENKKLRSPPGYGSSSSTLDICKKNNAKRKKAVTLKEGSLFKMCFRYISENIAILDSLVGLPEIIGKKLFDFMLDNDVLWLEEVPFQEIATTTEKSKVKCLSVFDAAYNTELLNSLSLCYLPKTAGLSSLLTNCFTNINKLDLSGSVLNSDTLCTISTLSR